MPDAMAFSIVRIPQWIIAASVATMCSDSQYNGLPYCMCIPTISARAVIIYGYIYAVVFYQISNNIVRQL